LESGWPGGRAPGTGSEDIDGAAAATCCVFVFIAKGKNYICDTVQKFAIFKVHVQYLVQ
jgi:hypothetical protein